MEPEIAGISTRAAADPVREIVALYALLRRDRPSIASHGASVADLSRALARVVGASSGEQHLAYVAGLLHDVGKLCVSELTLFKGEQLDLAEWKELRAHAAVGETLVLTRLGLPRVATIVGQHHERLDGRGYPRGLTSEHIDPIAKIVAVADAFTAMREERPYVRSRSRSDALIETQRVAGRQFDADVVNALKRILTVRIAA